MPFSERTPLTENPLRAQKLKATRFACCLGATVLTIFIFLSVLLGIFLSFPTPPMLPNSTDVPSVTTSAKMLQDNITLLSYNLLLDQTWPLNETSEGTTWALPLPSTEELKAARDSGIEALKKRDAIELIAPIPPVTAPTYRHQKAVGTSKEATYAARQGYIEDHATREVLRKNPQERSQQPWSIGRGPKLDKFGGQCPQFNRTSLCDHNHYRSPDGTCNNLQFPDTWGVAMRPFRRTLSPDYADGVSAPRVSHSTWTQLPSARVVSLGVHRPTYRSDPNFSVMLAVWGQFIDHDMTATALSKGMNGAAIQCCNVTAEQVHPECFPVELSPADPYFQQYNVTCMEFVRSAPAPTCSLGPREQINQASAFIDGSAIYGPNIDLMNQLRTGWSGRLRMLETRDNRTLLPASRDPNDGCNEENLNRQGKYCFESGDARANENLHLTTMHLIWARQHNRIADNLEALNPHWNDEKLFQETRKIITAQLQHIMYNEFLPILLGEEISERLNITSQKEGYWEEYDPKIDPTIANHFASAIFRFAHTLIPGVMTHASNYSSNAMIELHKMLFNPYSLWGEGGVDQAIKDALDTPINAVKPSVTKELSDKLFERVKPKPGAPCGLDLVSLNIQRGRDHGLPAYPRWRKVCGLSEITTWEDLQGVVDDGSIQNMKSIYSTVDDIDVYTGAVSEIPLGAGRGILGPLLTCLIADQFVRLKKGDRFWYETEETPQAFTPEQLQQIRQTTLAGILCGNADTVEESRKEVMRCESSTNTKIPCSDLDNLDITHWKDDPVEITTKTETTQKPTEFPPFQKWKEAQSEYINKNSKIEKNSRIKIHSKESSVKTLKPKLIDAN